MKKIILLVIYGAFIYNSIVAQSLHEVKDSLLWNLLLGKDPEVDKVLLHPDRYQFQLIYTQVEDSSGQVRLLKRSLFENQYYFNPASLIKMPLAAIALEKLSQMTTSGVGLKSHFFFRTCSCDKDADAYIDRHTDANLQSMIRELLVVSDNDAYNVLFGFVGMDFFNRRMRELGYHGTLLKRRFIKDCNEMQNRKFGGFVFETSDSGRFYQLPCDSSIGEYSIDGALPVKAGKKQVLNGKIVAGPKDFSNTNYFSLADANHFLIRLFLGGSANDALKMNADYRRFMKETMGMYPRELTTMHTLNKHIADYEFKYFLDPKRNATNDEGFRIYNKVGMSSGFLSDVSYFEDKKNGVRFFLSAAILATKDDVINNGSYTYFDFGIPVLRKIANIIYDLELSKRRNN